MIHSNMPISVGQLWESLSSRRTEKGTADKKRPKRGKEDAPLGPVRREVSVCVTQRRDGGLLENEYERSSYPTIGRPIIGSRALGPTDRGRNDRLQFL